MMRRRAAPGTTAAKSWCCSPSHHDDDGLDQDLAPCAVRLLISSRSCAGWLYRGVAEHWHWQARAGQRGRRGRSVGALARIGRPAQRSCDAVAALARPVEIVDPLTLVASRGLTGANSLSSREASLIRLHRPGACTAADHRVFARGQPVPPAQTWGMRRLVSAGVPALDLSLGGRHSHSFYWLCSGASPRRRRMQAVHWPARLIPCAL